MKTLIIGANGQIGKKLAKKLKDSSHEPIAMVRKEEQQKEFENMGVESVLADLEKDIDHAFDHVQAVVFTAGSGAHTGADKTDLVDRKGAKKAIDAAVKNNVDRFIMVSSMGTDQPPSNWPESMAHYLAAKADADKHLMQSNLNYTIIRPGRLTNENGTNNVRLAEELDDKQGEIPRTDVATLIEKTLDADTMSGKIVEVLEGKVPIDDAIKNFN